MTGTNNHEEVLSDVYKAMRGNISYGRQSEPQNASNSTGIATDNIDGTFAKIASTGTHDVQFSMTHNLNRIPIGFHVINKSKAGDFYSGATTWTATKIFLKCSVDNVSATFFIF